MPSTSLSEITEMLPLSGYSRSCYWKKRTFGIIFVLLPFSLYVFAHFISIAIPEQVRYDLRGFFLYNLNIRTDMTVRESKKNNVFWYSDLKLEYLINNPHKCENRKPFVLILVDTSPDHFSERKMIRETWGNIASWPQADEQHEVIVMFVLGVSRVETEVIQRNLVEENERYNDLIQQNFIDDFRNLTIKLINRLKWPILHCSDVKFLMKTDDDVFVHVGNLITHLKMIKPQGFYSGLVHSGSPRKIQNHSKYFVPSTAYRGAYYPEYCEGPGYILSMDSVEKFYVESFKTPMLYMEDVHAGILARMARIYPKQFNMLHGKKTAPTDLCTLSKFITSHGIEGSTALKFYEDLMKLKYIDPDIVCWGKLLSWVNPNDLVYF